MIQHIAKLLKCCCKTICLKMMPWQTVVANIVLCTDQPLRASGRMPHWQLDQKSSRRNETSCVLEGYKMLQLQLANTSKDHLETSPPVSIAAGRLSFAAGFEEGYQAGKAHQAVGLMLMLPQPP